MAFRDDCPKMQNGIDFDGKQLLTLVRSGNSPFHGVWNVNLLIQEVEENLNTHVVDIPIVYKGSNNYGFHLKLSNQPDIVARLARGDVNMPNFDGFPLKPRFPRPGSRWLSTIYCARSLTSWPLACFTTVFRCNTLVPDLMFLRILQVGACSCLKKQKERIMYGTISAQRGRPISLLRPPVFAHHYSTSISPSSSPLSGSANASLNRNPDHFPFPLLPHASSVSLFSFPRSKRQLGT